MEEKLLNNEKVCEVKEKEDQEIVKDYYEAESRQFSGCWD